MEIGGSNPPPRFFKMKRIITPQTETIEVLEEARKPEFSDAEMEEIEREIERKTGKRF